MKMATVDDLAHLRRRCAAPAAQRHSHDLSRPVFVAQPAHDGVRQRQRGASGQQHDVAQRNAAIGWPICLQRVGLRPEYMSRYPHAFSGGERQRIVVARALVTNPRLIVADEAVSALDVSIRAQILNLLEELQEEFQLTYLFISHDLSVIRHICDRVAVMYVGKLVETATIDDLYRQPEASLHRSAAVVSADFQPAPARRSRIAFS